MKGTRHPFFSFRRQVPTVEKSVLRFLPLLSSNDDDPDCFFPLFPLPAPAAARRFLPFADLPENLIGGGFSTVLKGARAAVAAFLFSLFRRDSESLSPPPVQRACRWSLSS